MLSPWIALPITFLLSVSWLRMVDFAAHRGWLESRLSRKIIHISTGPLFIVCWLLFADQPIARWLAALVPFAVTAQFALVGLGVIKDDAAVQAMSRTGDRRELLRGPLYYGIIFIVVTLLFWKNSPVGIVALMLLCGGDGLADVVGRRWGRTRLPWNQGKSWVGSAAMLLGGFGFAFLALWLFVAAGVFPGSIQSYVPGLALIALIGAVVETLPFSDLDNLTVSLASIATGLLVF
jgi:phytol kinase